MLNEKFVEAVGGLAVASTAPKSIDVGTKRIVSVNGDTEIHEIPPEPRNHTLVSVGDVVEAVSAYGTTDGATVFVDSDAVVVHFCSVDRRDIATMPLRTSAARRALEEADGESLSHSDFVRLLRVHLAGCVPDGFASLFAKVNFSRAKGTQSESRHDRESLGRSIESKVQGTDALPEEVRIDLPVWQHPLLAPYRAICRCAITANGDTEQFRLDVLGDSLQNSVDTAVLELRTELASSLERSPTPAVVLAGSPWSE